MQAVILVGGEGTRLRPLTYHIPKPLVPIANRPFLEHLIRLLRRHGITDIILSSGYKADAFSEAFGDGSRLGVRLACVVEQAPLGTAGAVRHVSHLLDNTFLVLNGDIFADVDLGELIAFHRAKGGVGTLTVTPVEDPSPYGVIETDASGRILRFLEKPKPHETACRNINAGIYVLEPEVLRTMPQPGNYSFERQIFPGLLATHKALYAYQMSAAAYWLDIGSPAKYIQAHHDALADRLELELPPPAADGLRIGAGVDIAPGARVEGPCLIADLCRIAAGAQVGPYTTLGEGVVVESGASVEESVVWPGAVIGSKAFLQRCVVGRGSRIGAGARVMPLALVGDGEVVEAGALVGEGEKVGQEPSREGAL